MPRPRASPNLSKLFVNDAIGIRAFVFDDPEGYQVEIQEATRVGRMSTLYVINPNSTQAVTDGVDAAIAPLRPMAEGLGVDIACLTLAEGPPGIESQVPGRPHHPASPDACRKPLRRRGFVIACFGDPGLHALRDRTAKPVLGIQEAAVATALTLGQRFGVIAILPASIPRHLRAFGAMGVMDRLAGDRALGLGVTDLANEDTTLARMTEIGTQLRDTDGADALILGCAGMARYRPALEATLGLPVIDPCQAATAAALGRIALNQTHKTGTDMLDETARGVFTIAVTPFLPDGALDLPSIDSMVDFYEDKGATGLTILGMMGEAGKLSAEESVEVVTRVTARASVPVIVGVSAPGLAAIGALARTAMDKGAAGVMVAPQGGLKSDDQILGYFANVAETLGDIPWVLQDFPLVTGVEMSPPSA
jgi:allantoin racemase